MFEPRDVAGFRLLIVGDSMADFYVTAREKYAQEEGDCFEVVGRPRLYPGGAANAAVIARALGCSVMLVTAYGDDDAGYELGQLLGARGVCVSPSHVGSTTTKTRYVNERGHALARIDHDVKRGIEPGTVDVSGAQAILLSDYAKGALDFLDLPRTVVPVVLDPKIMRPSLHGVSAVTPNALEFARIMADPAKAYEVRSAANAWRHHTESPGATVYRTLGKHGTQVIPPSHGEFRHELRPPRWEDRPAVGAGDAFAVGVAVALGLNASALGAGRFAVALASLYVRQGRDELPTIGAVLKAVQHVVQK